MPILSSLQSMMGLNAPDNAELNTLNRTLPSNPSAIGAASLEVARSAYRESFGLVIASTYGSALRRAEAGEQPDASDEDAVELHRRTGLIADERSVRQLRVELDRSGLVAVTVPAAALHGRGGAAWEALEPLAATAPAITSADRASVTLLFARPAGDVGTVRRCLELDLVTAGADMAKFRPSGDQSNVIPLPHRGTLETWLRLPRNPPSALPEELAVLLRTEAAVSDSDVSLWLQDHYRAAKRGEDGLKRADVYAAILAANNWLPTDFDVHQLSRAFASVFDSRRLASGIEWRIVRREDVPTLKTMRGVSVETIDPVELAAFRCHRASLELSPTRKAARAEAAAAAKQRAEAQAYITASYGTPAVFDMLRDEDYPRYHHQAEGRRYRSAGQYGAGFVALQLMRGGPSEFPPGPTIYAEPSWWTLSPPGTPPADRYKRLVQVVLEGGAK